VFNPRAKKKADVVQHPWVSNHVGLLFIKPAAEAACPSFSHPTNEIRLSIERQNLNTARSSCIHHSGCTWEVKRSVQSFDCHYPIKID
jgi:hypothetical protein